MSTAIYTKNTKQSTKWLHILQQELPSHTIEIYPQISDFTTVEFLICWKPYNGLLDKFPNLKAIQSLGAGVDHIFDENTVDPNIQVSKIVDHQLTHDMWEHALSIVLSDMKNLPLYNYQQSLKKWKPKLYKRNKDITIGILGLGTIGSYVASHFSLLGFNVVGWSKSVKMMDGINTFEGEEGIEMVCKEADYLINILPLTSETKGILNKDLFAKLKPTCYIINVGRGDHLVDEDLIARLDSDQLRGAALDVFAAEPLPENHDFWTHPKIFITPHIASLTNIESVYPQIVENIQRLSAGKSLLNKVDVEKEY